MTAKTVYIASPYSKGDVALNVRRSIVAADRLFAEGFLPFCPLLTHFWHLIIPHTWEYWMEMDKEWLTHCDCVLRLEGESKGADEEVLLAMELGKPVYYNLDSLIADKAAEWPMG